MNKTRGNILIIDDDAGVLQTARFILKQYFSRVEISRKPEEIGFLISQHQYDVVLLDMNFSPGEASGDAGISYLREITLKSPSTSVVMITAYGELRIAVEAMKNGATDFIVKPWENEKFIATIHSAYQLSKSKNEVHALKSIAKSTSNKVNFVGESKEIKNVMSLVAKIAPTLASALILGENGTGKELIAQLIHEQSDRNDMPFVKVDLGSLSSTLFESELFGYMKGSFTDASSEKQGRFELADGGTIFLDEIGNIEIGLQAKLLSVIQNQEVYRIGSSIPIPIDLRVICATNRDIRKEVDEGRFREDLYYRLNTFEITVPPLRERKDDIPIICKSILSRLFTRYRKEDLHLSSEALMKLTKWSWPGNVRELEHTLERGVIMAESNTIQVEDLNLASGITKEVETEVNIKSLEQRAIQLAMNKFNGNMTKVALELGIGRTTLYRKLKQYGL